MSSREHSGSTFTFVLPYKVSTTFDHSDDPDELSDMANHDTIESFFQFQPRTLGSLFSSNGPTSNQMLLPHTMGYTRSHKLNGFSHNSYSFPSNKFRSNDTASVDDACSVVDDAHTPCEPESYSCQMPDPHDQNVVFKSKQSQDGSQNPITDSIDHTEASIEVPDVKRTKEPQGTSQRQEKSQKSSQSISSSCMELPKSTLKPKILLVEDNKTIIMVTKSMLKLLGHAIDVVNNGVEAVCAVQRCSYDLILMVIS